MTTGLPYPLNLLTQMPLTAPVAFARFIRSISLAGDQASVAETRRARIVELLGGSFQILESFPTGSMMRGTALQGRSDLDVFVVLHFGKHVKGKSPRQLLENVRDALSNYNNRLTKKNGQAVTLYFTSAPNVDVVPVSRTANAQGVVTHYNVPDMISGTWLTARPHRHNTAMAAVSESKRQLVRMVKVWNAVHSSVLQSYHLEVLALNMPEVDVASGWPFEVRYFFQAAFDLLAAPLSHPDVHAGFADTYLTPATRKDARDRVATAWSWAKQAEDAVYKGDMREAMRLYRLIFGSDFPAYA